MKPVIGYRNFGRSPLSYIGPDADLAFNGLTYDGWKALAVGLFEFGFISAGNVTCDYVGIAAHNLTGSVQVRANGSTIASYPVIGTSPFLIRFPATTANRWTVQVQNFNTPARVNVCNIGLALELERGFWVGHSPMTHNRNNRFLNNLSESGQFVGRKLISEGANGSIQVDNISSAWIRDQWAPFSRDAEKYGFFLQHNPFQYPREVAYCWTTGDATVTQDGVGGPNNAGLNSVSMNVRGIV